MLVRAYLHRSPPCTPSPVCLQLPACQSPRHRLRHLLRHQSSDKARRYNQRVRLLIPAIEGHRRHLARAPGLTACLYVRQILGRGATKLHEERLQGLLTVMRGPGRPSQRPSHLPHFRRARRAGRMVHMSVSHSHLRGLRTQGVARKAEVALGAAAVQVTIARALHRNCRPCPAEA